nr:docking protein 1 isoform X2 [Pogona vitticeps]
MVRKTHSGLGDVSLVACECVCACVRAGGGQLEQGASFGLGFTARRPFGARDGAEGRPPASPALNGSRCRPCLQRWKKNWFVLYQASPHGVARLEFFDCKDGAPVADRVATKRLDRKIVRLANCLSIAPAPDGSSKEGLATFRLETSERTYLFATEPLEAADWVAKLCEAAFPHSPGRVAQPADGSGEERTLEMATNAIYFSREEVKEFWVTVQKTEASERCKLQGGYVLKASRDSLILAESPSGQPLYTWPYRLLRRYGRDKVMFSFEAGRRCESGPGNFTFETKQGNEIFHVVEAAIHAQKAQAEENRQSGTSLDTEIPGLAQIQDTMANALHLAGEGLPLERRGPGAALAPRPSCPLEEKDKAVAPPKGPVMRGCNQRPCHATAPSGLVGKPGHPRPPCEDTANVYSEPLDAVKGHGLRPDPLYADPADSKPEGSGAKEEVQRPASWLLYEQVGPGVSGWQHPQSIKGHIYDEPEGRAPLPAPAPTAIYDEARFPCEAWRTQGLATQAGYELPYLPSAGDYAVPAFPQKAEKRPPKPCPAPKPPRSYKEALQLGGPSKGHSAPGPDQDRPKLGSGSNCNNNSNNHPHPPEPIYSRVQKLPPAPLAGPIGCAGQEQSVDGSRPASVYEDLGEI